MARVLLVEDSPTQALQLKHILEKQGFQVVTAPDAECAFDCLQRDRFDVVLSDLLLPGDSGFDLCRRIKATPELERLPVVVHTSQADPANVLRGLEAGADGFMTKDREPDEIVGRLRRVLARSGGHSSVDGTGRIRVRFLKEDYCFAADKEQLVDILVSAFEDVVHLNRRHEESGLELCKLNIELQAANRDMEQSNLQLVQLADELAEAARSERQAHEDLKTAQCQLVQSEKLAALGQLVAGVAHEINNPLAFVGNNIVVLQRDTGALRELLELYRQAESSLAPESLTRIRELSERIDLPYTLGNLDGLLARFRDGLRRIQQIVKDLRDFARLDESDQQEVDLSPGIESTVNIVRSQAKKQGVEIEMKAVSLPRVTCCPAKINQVVLNLLVNAIDACSTGGRVTIQTCAEPSCVEIHVQDTGCGIDPAIAEKVFDPFFTTKPVGKGTGLGLSISYRIIKDHGGSIHFESTPGQGTHFVVRLPREGA